MEKPHRNGMTDIEESDSGHNKKSDVPVLIAEMQRLNSTDETSRTVDIAQ
jgi:hypothetical protein